MMDRLEVGTERTDHFRPLPCSLQEARVAVSRTGARRFGMGVAIGSSTEGCVECAPAAW